ncbi:hypothetical protein [uncultured Kordia sp.]|uniref:hypothetical protein n=1 Tax=uncultured Kordia sp. TaxID=507699 RepID=UPI0026122766|nr:hypothetical protein [uncultured Kordia sp.]
MKKRSLKNLALNKQAISNFEYCITGGLFPESKTGGCNTVSLILQCPAPEPTKDPVPSPITDAVGCPGPR